MNEVYRDIQQHIPYLRRYAGALANDPSTADDLVQDCVVNALSKCHLYRNGTNLRGWLSTILRNQHISNVRRQGRAGVTVDPDDTASELATEPVQEHRLTIETVQSGLRALPSEQRTLIEAVALDDRSYQDVAKRFGMNLGTVKSRISRGRRHLRQALEGQCRRHEKDAHYRSNGTPRHHESQRSVHSHSNKRTKASFRPAKLAA